MNTIKESSKKFPAFKSNIVTQAPDPLFAGIAMKIMGNNRSSPFAAKALAPVKASKASSNGNTIIIHIEFLYSNVGSMCCQPQKEKLLILHIQPSNK